MNKIVKDGENGYVIFGESGELVAYLKKNRFGTHGHWKGWNHFLYCDQVSEFVWAGAEFCRDNYLGKWTDAPVIFLNIKEAKQYYCIQ